MNFIYPRRYIAVFCFLMFIPVFAAAQTKPVAGGKVLDQIVAVVNNHIILKSDVDSVLAQYMMSAKGVKFTPQLWYQALESEVDKLVLLEQAKIDSVTVTDDEVEKALNQRIKQLEKQIGSQKELESYFGKSIVELKAQWKGFYRQDAIVQKMRQSKLGSIKITRPEVLGYFNSIPPDSLPRIPESIDLSQIIRIPPPDSNAVQNAYRLAEELRDSIIVYHKNFEELAKRWSQGPSATSGGHIGLINVKDLVPEYAAAAAALKPGEISQVVRSPFGFHIIRLNKRVGDKIDTNHILIKVDESKRDDAKAIRFLKNLRDSVLVYHKLFADMARKYSQDQATAPAGGQLIDPQTGNYFIPLTGLDPALYRVVIMLNKAGEISPPKPYTINNPGPVKAYRIVRLNNHLDEHRANLAQDYDLIKSYALQNKKLRIMRQWLQQLRKQIFVEYLVPVPRNETLLGNRAGTG